MPDPLSTTRAATSSSDIFEKFETALFKGRVCHVSNLTQIITATHTKKELMEKSAMKKDGRRLKGGKARNPCAQ
jgi:hypothetical protein